MKNCENLFMPHLIFLSYAIRSKEKIDKNSMFYQMIYVFGWADSLLFLINKKDIK